MWEPFKQYSYYLHFIATYRINKPPSIWQVVFPKVVYPVPLFVDFGYKPFGYLYTALWISFQVISGSIKELVQRWIFPSNLEISLLKFFIRKDYANPSIIGYFNTNLLLLYLFTNSGFHIQIIFPSFWIIFPDSSK